MLQDLYGCKVIIDELLFCGNNIEEHDVRLNKVQMKIAENNIKLNKEKCVFRKEKVTHMGHELSRKCIPSNAGKIRAMEQMRAREHHRVANYMSKLIPNLSQKQTLEDGITTNHLMATCKNRHSSVCNRVNV